MVLQGRIEHGAVVLSSDVLLPEGAFVTVIVEPPSQKVSNSGPRVQLPLVKSKHAGTRGLTAERVAEILDEDDLSR